MYDCCSDTYCICHIKQLSGLEFSTCRLSLKREAFTSRLKETKIDHIYPVEFSHTFRL